MLTHSIKNLDIFKVVFFFINLKIGHQVAEKLQELLEFKQVTLERQQAIEERLADVTRQSHKDSLVLYGPEIPKAKNGENVTQIFCSLIKYKYGITIDKNQVLYCNFVVWNVKHFIFCLL